MRLCMFFFVFCFCFFVLRLKQLRGKNVCVHGWTQISIHSSIHPFIQLIIDYLNEQMNEYKLTGYDFEQTNERFSSWLVKWQIKLANWMTKVKPVKIDCSWLRWAAQQVVTDSWGSLKKSAALIRWRNPSTHLVYECTYPPGHLPIYPAVYLSIHLPIHPKTRDTRRSYSSS